MESLAMLRLPQLVLKQEKHLLSSYVWKKDWYVNCSMMKIIIHGIMQNKVEMEQILLMNGMMVI